MRTGLIGVALLATALTACDVPDEYIDGSPAQNFFEAVSVHCGKAYAGKLASNDAVDADFKSKAMVMHVASCSDDVIRIPFFVDDDRSRTWVITRVGNDRLELKHDHRHEDGSDDAVTMYGGTSETDGSVQRQEFPVDQFSIDLFKREGLTASVTNVWAMEIDERMFAYELTRANREFRVEFDLTTAVDTPPPAWGDE